MPTSELITPAHLARKAIIYVRQSSPQQVLSNQESLRLQYALRDRAVSFGWRPEDITLIDSDLGLSASSAQQREGFKEVLAQVTLGQVGIILSSLCAKLPLDRSEPETRCTREGGRRRV
ncbi:MAG: recombinase family protein [Chloroflexales bacterium]|nr:recombinase family protein [Chloroflexales bacterium]